MAARSHSTADFSDCYGKVNKSQISGKDATEVALEAQKYGPLHIDASDNSVPNSETSPTMAKLPENSGWSGEDCGSPAPALVPLSRKAVGRQRWF